jgi:hypothetical protein
MSDDRPGRRPAHALTVSHGSHVVALVPTGGGLAVAVALAAREWTVHRRPLLLACLAGGAVAFFTEPIWDVLQLIDLREDGATHVFSAFGRAEPVWLLLAYPVYVGGGAFLFTSTFRSGADQRRLWLVIGCIFLLDLAIEFPMTSLGVLDYYGRQPFKLAGFPLWLLFPNAGGGLVSGAILARRADLFEGRRVLLAVVLVPGTFAAWEVFASWPTSLVINSDAGPVAAGAAALLTIAISIGAALMLGRELCAAREPERPQPLAAGRAAG